MDETLMLYAPRWGRPTQRSNTMVVRTTDTNDSWNEGGNIKAVQRMLGHKEASVTLDRYGHPYDSALIGLAAGPEGRYGAA